jgi:hypothetical protein
LNGAQWNVTNPERALRRDWFTRQDKYTLSDYRDRYVNADTMRPLVIGSHGASPN